MDSVQGVRDCHTANVSLCPYIVNTILWIMTFFDELFVFDEAGETQEESCKRSKTTLETHCKVKGNFRRQLICKEFLSASRLRYDIGSMGCLDNVDEKKLVSC